MPGARSGDARDVYTTDSRAATLSVIVATYCFLTVLYELMLQSRRMTGRLSVLARSMN